MFALALFAVTVDSPSVEWLFANWLNVAVGAIAALLGWRNRVPLVNAAAKLAGVKARVAAAPAAVPGDAVPGDVDDDGDPDWVHPDDHRRTLAAALCLISDHVQELNDKAGIEACKTLAPIVLLNPPDAPPAPVEVAV